MFKFLIYHLIFGVAVQGSTTSKMFHFLLDIDRAGWLASKPTVIPYIGTDKQCAVECNLRTDICSAYQFVNGKCYIEAPKSLIQFTETTSKKFKNTSLWIDLEMTPVKQINGCNASVGYNYELPCIFPFISDNRRYDRCAGSDYTGPWCATEIDKYTGDYLHMGYCGDSCMKDNLPTCNTISGQSCIFPFTYYSNGLNYTKCTTQDQENGGGAWCATYLDSNGFTYGYQGYDMDFCSIKCLNV